MRRCFLFVSPNCCSVVVVASSVPGLVFYIRFTQEMGFLGRKRKKKRREQMQSIWIGPELAQLIYRAPLQEVSLLHWIIHESYFVLLAERNAD
ncbi:hypothetical protein CDAR_379061 [Caerostris darwini]|uniref:Secreted protein n=1 Tax=Caerostris darwini TaxID=1538125 RepID=A0AAV4TYT1_9ARAC|nr:hypothetical protein CDAR_379061 [Caerostris darwini]